MSDCLLQFHPVLIPMRSRVEWLTTPTRLQFHPVLISISTSPRPPRRSAPQSAPISSCSDLDFDVGTHYLVARNKWLLQFHPVLISISTLLEVVRFDRWLAAAPISSCSDLDFDYMGGGSLEWPSSNFILF